jgi:hypothetical protein
LKDKNRKEYNTFIQKYKFTLDYNDAVELKCFEQKEINEIKNEFSENMKKYNLNKNNINTNNIKSLSKLKLFNMLFFLLNEENIDLEYIYTKILSYSNPITLIFKIPNRFGNEELLFYTYLTFFVDLITFEIRKNESQKKK